MKEFKSFVENVQFEINFEFFFCENELKFKIRKNSTIIY